MIRNSTDSAGPRALVVLADGAEEMEVCIVVDLLRRAKVEVMVAGLAGPGPVRCSRGVVITPDTALSEARGPFSALVLPGGAGGAEALASSPEVGGRLGEQVDAGQVVGAICAGPLALCRHGYFADYVMTSHPSVRDEVASHASIYREEPVVEDRGLVTSRGPGTAFAFGLSLIRRLLGEQRAQEVASPLMLPPS